VTKKPWTAEELCRLPEGWRYEIDEGELVIMAPAGFEHNDVTTEIATRLRQFTKDHGLGKALTNELGIFLRRAPDTLRAPDVAFYSNDRLASIRDRKGFPDVPPDLAVEVHDPSEPDLAKKIRQYLEAGVRAVWVVDLRTRTLTRHAPGEEPRVWSDPESVVEEPVLPGFSCRLGELFGEE
ncbi:MAG: Uma2 family endonuclease, partial [Clostridia bacterium]|nr:Uma2 family endonuclease [Clostridia bacterium]